MSEHDDIEREMQEKALREAIWIALYFAQKLQLPMLIDQLTAIRRDLLAVEVV